jgi:putative transposase
LRNASSIWYEAIQDFFKGKSGLPRVKNRTEVERKYACFTSDIIQYKIENKKVYISLGSKNKNTEILPVSFPISLFNSKINSEGKIELELPKMIWIKPIRGKKRNKFSISFTYNDFLDISPLDEIRELTLQKTQEMSLEEIEKEVEAVDVGVVVSAHTTKSALKWKDGADAKINKHDKRIAFFQRKAARQKKGSSRRKKTLNKIVSLYENQKNIRKNENHHISKKIITEMEEDNKSILVFEDIQLINMTASSKGTIEEPGTNVAQKSGLNKAILNRALGQLKMFTKYKAHRKGFAVYKINPKNTSRECANCGFTLEANRRSQKEFRCVSCGHTDNADHNASLVIKKRAVIYLSDSRTELGSDGLLKEGRNSKVGRSGLTTSKSLVSHKETTRTKKKAKFSSPEAPSF